MSAQPKFTDLGPGDFSDTRREEAVARDTEIERRAKLNEDEYLQDPARLIEALGDISTLKAAQTKKLARLIRDGSDDCELGKLLRKMVGVEVANMACTHAAASLDREDRA